MGASDAEKGGLLTLTYASPPEWDCPPPRGVCSRPYSVKSTAAVHCYKPMSTRTHTEDIDHDGITLLEGKRAEEAGQKNEIFA